MKSDMARMWQWGVIALASLVFIGLAYPQQIGPMVVKLSIGSLGAYGGYWIDRSAFHVRPHEAWAGFVEAPSVHYGIVYVGVCLRRALIIVGMGMTAALGL